LKDEYALLFNLSVIVYHAIFKEHLHLSESMAALTEQSELCSDIFLYWLNKQMKAFKRGVTELVPPLLNADSIV
jgi:hypothetical protein